MAVTEQAAEIDEQKLGAFMNQAVGELGATLGAALVVIGDQLGLYKAMAGAGPLTPDELAERTGTSRALRARVAERPGGGRLRHLRPRDAAPTTLPPEQALALADESSPVFLCGAFQLIRVARARRAEDPRGVHERRRRRLARAPPRPVRGHRAVLPPGLQRAPRRPSGSRRSTASRTKLQRRHPRGRRRLRPRRLDDPDGEGVPGLAVRRLRLPRGVDRGRAPAGRGGRRGRPRALRGRARERASPARYDLVACSTACTTWATRSALRATCSARSTTTARG